MLLFRQQKSTYDDPFPLFSADKLGIVTVTDQLVSEATSSVLNKQSLIKLLSEKHTSVRSEREARLICDLIKHEPFFASISKDFKTLLEISGWIEYRKVMAKDEVYRINDPAECFYIILSGEVHLTAPEETQEEQEEDQQEQSEDIFPSQLYVSSISSVPAFNKRSSQVSANPPRKAPEPVAVEELRATTGPARRLKRMMTVAEPQTPVIIMPPPPMPPPPQPKKELVMADQIVKIMGTGECFGEVGDTLRRGTNAVAAETTHLMVVRKIHYDTISRAQLKSVNKTRYQFLVTLPLLKLAYRYTLEAMLYALEEVKVGYNGVVYREGESLRYVHILYRGEFKLYRKAESRKQPAHFPHQEEVAVQEQRVPQRNFCFRTVENGEILGYLQGYYRIAHHGETCICKSQEGVILRIDKAKFIKKLTTADNNLPAIDQFMQTQMEARAQLVSDFEARHTHNPMFVRMMHTPASAKGRRVRTEAGEVRQQRRESELKRLSTCPNNFFSKFNRTFTREHAASRISVKRGSNPQQKDYVPSRVRDVVEMVEQESNYHQLRQRTSDLTLFQINLSKVPRHIKKKYELLFRRQSQKKVAQTVTHA